MYSMRAVWPFLASGKMRIGNRADGGYVVPQRLIESSKVLLSFGISDDWSFEEDLRRHKPLNMYLFDSDVSHRWHLSGIKQMAKNGNLIGARLRFVKWIRFVLFCSRRGIWYRALGIAHEVSKGYLDIDAVFHMVIQRHSLSGRQVLLKMDIEGAEYEVLPDLKRHLSFVAGVVAEFHDLAVKAREFENIVQIFRDNRMFVCHVHANNYAPLVSDSNLPTVLEVTFQHEQFFDNGLVPDNSSYPCPGLDYPNNPSIPDLKFDFTTEYASSGR